MQLKSSATGRENWISEDPILSGSISIFISQEMSRTIWQILKKLADVVFNNLISPAITTLGLMLPSNISLDFPRFHSN